MEYLPSELLNEIFMLLPMPDKRNFIRCNKWCNELCYRFDIKKYEKQFIDNIVGKQILSGPITDLEKYTAEIMYYGYDNLLLDRYIRGSNRLYRCPSIYFHCARENHHNMIKKLHTVCRQTYLARSDQLLKGAAFGGHLQLLQWLRANGCHIDGGIISYAAKGGQLCTFRWLLSHGYGTYSSSMMYAVENSNTKILEWLKSRGHVFDTLAWDYAVAHGTINSLSWLLENGCVPSTNSCAKAAVFDQFEILKWLRERGVAWGINDHSSPIKNKAILKWLDDNGSPW